MNEIIINADDFGISKGVNEAIILMHSEGNLQSASIIINAKYTVEAVQMALKNPNLKVGLHFNLTTGKSVLHQLSIPLLVNKNGIFKNGFLKLLLISVIKRRQFLHEVEAELKAQIAFLKHYQISPSHIDGHRHIHYILGIFNVVKKIATTENIPRIRIINENLFSTLKLGKIPPISGLIKWFVLSFLGLINGVKKYSKDNKVPYFFSIIHSCKITNDLVKNLKIKNFQSIEIMLHPSIKKFDANEELEYEKGHLNSDFRTLEAHFIKPKL